MDLWIDEPSLSCSREFSQISFWEKIIAGKLLSLDWAICGLPGPMHLIQKVAGKKSSYIYSWLRYRYCADCLTVLCTVLLSWSRWAHTWTKLQVRFWLGGLCGVAKLENKRLAADFGVKLSPRNHLEANSISHLIEGRELYHLVTVIEYGN